MRNILWQAIGIALLLCSIFLLFSATATSRHPIIGSRQEHLGTALLRSQGWTFGGTMFRVGVTVGTPVSFWAEPTMQPSNNSFYIILRSQLAMFAPLVRQEGSRYVAEFSFDLPAEYWVQLLPDGCENGIFGNFSVSVLVSHHNGPRRPWFPTSVCSYGKTVRKGRWINCKYVPAHSHLSCGAEGWLWVPYECYYEIREARDLRALQNREYPGEPYWIAILGDSRTRGLWLSLINQLLPPQARLNLTASAIWKVWGYLDYKEPQLRISWRDLRSFDDESDNSFNESMPAVEMDLMNHLTAAKGQKPNVIFAQHGFLFLAKHSWPRVVGLEGWHMLKLNNRTKSICLDDLGQIQRASRVVAQHRFDVLESSQILFPMYRELCSEYPTHHIHLHTSCGNALVGMVNEMTSKIIASLVLSGERLLKSEMPPSRSFQVCYVGTPKFSARYQLGLPEPRCMNSIPGGTFRLQSCTLDSWNGCSNRSVIWNFQAGNQHAALQ